MSFASDKLYNGYLRRNMPMIVSNVKVREIMVHLPCLTLHDRETIEAKRETHGNFNSMVLLLDCLRRRENWPEQFIEALEACEQTTMAAEIRAEYNALRGATNSSPSSPSTTAVRADVHSPPAASRPDSGGNAAAAGPSAPPQPAAQPSPPLTIPVHQQAPSSAAHAPVAVPPPEPVSQPPQSPQVEVGRPTSTPPASPQTPPPPPPQREVLTHQEPEENSESDIQGSPPPSSCPVEQQVPDAPAPATAATELRPPQSPSPTQANSDVTDGSSFLTLTPERPPVQDTAPPLGKTPAVVLEPEETSEPPTAQVINSSPQSDTAAATVSPLPAAAARMDTSVNDDLSICMSKPGELVSIQPQNHVGPSVPAHNQPVEPYSGDSQRLEISEAPSDAVSSAPIPVCQENGVAATHNEPEENHYESLCESSEVRVNVGHVSEEPSILNLDVQISPPQAQIVNGEAAREISPPAASPNTTADTVSSSNTASGESCRPCEPAPAVITPERKTLPDSEEKKPVSHTLPSKYIMTAAGVGAFALLMAWKLKN